MKSKILSILLSIITLIVIQIWDVFAQDISNQLVFTEAMIDKKDSQVWFEIFNPTDKNISLVTFRISGIRTTNILPPEIRQNNGVELKPGERVIVCGDKESFTNKFGGDIKLLEIKLIKDINEGGFVIMNHMDGVENTNNIIRFGTPEKSMAVASKVQENEIIDFSYDNMSYSRNINNSKLTNWFKTIPSPGN